MWEVSSSRSGVRVSNTAETAEECRERGERTRCFGGGRGGQQLSPSQLTGEETACCHESGGTHVER